MPQTNALVSVIIPVYNVEDYLCACVDSVLNQTYQNLEIILVNDGSKDRSGELCDQYAAQPRVRALHQQNGGLSRARNAGLDAARGEFVYFMDSDDLITPDAIDLLVKHARHTNADLLFFDSDVFGAVEGSPYANGFYMRKGVYPYAQGPKMLERLMENGEYRSAVPLLFFRREFLLRKGLRFQNDIIYEDELFTFYAFSMDGGGVTHVSERLYQRRVRSGSITSNAVGPHNMSSILFVVNEVAQECAGNATMSLSLKQACVTRLTQSVFSVYHRLPKKERRPFEKELDRLEERFSKLDYFKSPALKTLLLSGRKTSWKNKAVRRLSPFIPASAKQKAVRLMGNRKCASQYAAEFDTLRSSSGQRRILITGTPVHGNLGDHAIAMAEECFFSGQFPGYMRLEIPMPMYVDGADRFAKHITEKDILCISGGGWLGDVWLHNEIMVRDFVKRFPKNLVIILPQTVYYTHTKYGRAELEITRDIYRAHKRLIFCLRDEASYQMVKDEAFLLEPERILPLPDMVLYLRQEAEQRKRGGALVCFRADREQSLSRELRQFATQYLWSKNIDTQPTTTVYLHNIPRGERRKAVAEKLQEYSRARLVVTDRLHSMLFAYLTGTPCVAFDNSTGKVRGVYQWIRSCNYVKVVSNMEEAQKYMDAFLDENFTPKPGQSLEKEFVPLVERINYEYTR